MLKKEIRLIQRAKPRRLKSAMKSVRDAKKTLKSKKSNKSKIRLRSFRLAHVLESLPEVYVFEFQFEKSRKKFEYHERQPWKPQKIGKKLKLLLSR